MTSETSEKDLQQTTTDAPVLPKTEETMPSTSNLSDTSTPTGKTSDEPILEMPKEWTPTEIPKDPQAATPNVSAAEEPSSINTSNTSSVHPIVPNAPEVVHGKQTQTVPGAGSTTAFIKELFANGNDCITAPSGSFPIKEDTRLLLALFSNGRFLVSETYKYDGRVLSFEVLAKRRRLQVGKPEYVPMVVISDIYDYAAKMKTASADISEEESHEQVRMQRDFITIVSRAAMNRVSDIHIVVADHTTVMFRINGLMQTEMEYNKAWGESFVRAAFASADISDSNYAQNEYQAAQKLGRTPLRGSHGKLMLPRNVLGIRLQFNPIAFGSRYVVMRLLYAEEDSQEASNIQALGFNAHEAELFYRLRAVPVGMVIISGPTGSGKSTTLQRNMIAMLQERNYETNLITVEDPPEYPIPGARQMPVTNAMIEEAKDREFTKALAAALRSDPDSLMIGEIRTLSAADLAFRGALSGHNVWTTLHANSAPAVIMRLRDMGVEDFKLLDPELMKGMLAQRLFRKICPYCRIAAKDQLTNPTVMRLREAYGDVGLERAFLRGPGCKHCDFRGVKGRTVIGEFILPDATFLELMIKGEQKKAINYWKNELNGRTLRENTHERMLQGLIDIDEAERWTGFLNDQIT